MKSYKVYRNLHTKTFSLMFDGRVVDHPTEILVHNARFVVSTKGREKVGQTKRKNVHATVRGYQVYTELDLDKLEVTGSITYNPYTHQEFMLGGMEIHELPLVLLKDNKMYSVKLK